MYPPIMPPISADATAMINAKTSSLVPVSLPDHEGGSARAG
jgi:hypothetical protein